jgi:hypothetical protein
MPAHLAAIWLRWWQSSRMVLREFFPTFDRVIFSFFGIMVFRMD